MMDIQEIIVHQVVLQGLVFAQHIPWKHKVRKLMKADSVPMASGLDCRVMVLSACIVLVLSRVVISHASKAVISHVHKVVTSHASRAVISHVSKAVTSHVRVINHVSRVVTSHVSQEVTSHAAAISHAVVISHASKAASTRVVMVIVHAHRDMILMQNIA